MFGNRNRRRGYKFTEKTHSKRGIIATILALMLLILYGALTYLSFFTSGNLSLYYGSVGVIALFVAVVGLFMALGSLREEDSFHLFPRLSVLVSLVNVALWIWTYVRGF